MSRRTRATLTLSILLTIGLRGYQCLSNTVCIAVTGIMVLQNRNGKLVCFCQ